MRRDIDERIATIAGRRFGAFHRDEVAAAGGDKYLVRRREAAGVWRRWWLDVFTLTAHPASHEQVCWVALLAAGPEAHLSFESAGELHRLAAVERGHIVVTTHRANRIEIPGVEFHQLDDIKPHHRETIAGFPTTTPARTLVDLAARLPPSRLDRAVEDAVVRRLVTFRAVDSLLGEVRRRGKPGVTNLVRVLDARAGEPPPASTLERMLHRAAAKAGVSVVRQHPLPSRGVVRGLVDVAVLRSKLILEADGRRWHTRIQDMARDRLRDREAARLGWLTLRFVYEDLRDDLAGCVDDIAATHAARARG